MSDDLRKDASRAPAGAGATCDRPRERTGLDIRETILSLANRLWQVNPNSEHAQTGDPPAGWTYAQWQLSHATSGVEEIYEWLEFHKSPEYAKAFRGRFDVLRELASKADRSKRGAALFRLNVRSTTRYLQGLANRFGVRRRKPEGRKKRQRAKRTEPDRKMNTAYKLYQQGYSYRGIADILLQEHVIKKRVSHTTIGNWVNIVKNSDKRQRSVRTQRLPRDRRGQSDAPDSE